ncbi:MAG: BlaI/MecI/CopY family transcriptional regulator [Prolixibacteraceae bacterium]|jgi:predicted transcriptional regulator|nr:BlaI/MecI/CopY family transcriptional regulator [Prolixibacteraceae bacterium]
MARELTRSEEQVMQILWELERAFVKDIVEQIPDPKPAYNTVSTIVRILEKKGFVGYEAFGKTHRYFPLMSKKEYTRLYMKNFMKNYFSNSFKEMVSFFAKEDKMSISELEELMKEVGKDLDDNQKREP